MDRNRWLALLETHFTILYNIDNYIHTYFKYEDTGKMSKVSLLYLEYEDWVDACAEPKMPLRQCQSFHFSLAWLRIERESGRGDSSWAMLFTQATSRQHISSDLRLFPLLLDFLPVPWLQLPDTTLFEVLGVNRETLTFHRCECLRINLRLILLHFTTSVRANRSWSWDA